MITDHDRFLFDLNGYLLIKGALSPEEVAEGNSILDTLVELDPPLKHGEWYGYIQGQTFGGVDGMNLQQIYEAGGVFERMIDHPSWHEHMLEFMGGQGTFDYHHGPLFIDENFASLRGPGDAIGIHSGGQAHTKRNSYRVMHGQFMVMQINALVAFTDIGPGDGATMVIPGSHKANFEPPEYKEHTIQQGEATSAEGVTGAVEVHMDAGDCLLFTDTICHGSAKRVNPGLRRITVYRYGPSWGFFRHPYRPSRAMLERLTEQQRQIVWPHEPIPRKPNRMDNIPDPTP